MSHVVGTGESTAGLDHLFDVWEITHNSGLAFEDKVQELFELETDAFDLPYAFVSRTDVENDRQTIELAVGSHDLLQAGESCPLSESYCRKTIAEPEGVISVDDAEAEGWGDDPAYERFELGTYVGARIEVDGGTFGTFCFASSDPRTEPLTPEERQLVELLAMWAGNELTTERPSDGDVGERQPDQVDELVRMVSHDLRSPLGVAGGHVQLLEESVQESLEQIRTAHRRMETLIQQLLTLARVDEPVTEPSSVDLATCVDNAWEMVRTGNARLEQRFGSAHIAADPDRLENLFENLFRNSVEHGSTGPHSQAREDSVEHGSTGGQPQADEHNSASDAEDEHEDTVTVAVGLTERGFYVADDGPGISLAERDAVFDPGYTGAEDGTGFGLSIVERIADAHGWDVTVTEGEHGGARFDFTGVSFLATDDREA
jgi:signal transduction histidine kinase